MLHQWSRATYFYLWLILLSLFLQEKEINLLRDTHSRNILSSTDGTATVDHVFLGKEGQDFKFSHLANKVI